MTFWDHLSADEARERLNRAAPALLEALELAVAYLSEVPHGPAVKIASAIALAKGQEGQPE